MQREIPIRRPGAARRLLLAAGLVLSLPGAALAAPTMSDAAMADEIEEELLFDHSIAHDDIDVDVAAGIAELNGSVDSAVARIRAERLAATVKGVLSVDNDLVVTPRVARDDEAIRRDINDALLYDPATESYEVDADVDRGMVTLTGAVDSWHEKQLSERVAAGVRGVQGVINRIDIEYDAERLDSEIRAEITQRMKFDTLVGHDDLAVSIDDGKVTLEGTVASLAEKQRAISNAWTAGVDDVDASGLDVAWDADLVISFVPTSDAAIADAIMDTLAIDARVPEEAISIAVDDGVAKLHGTVSHLKARRAATELARNVAGVDRVKDRIKVRPQVMPADSTIGEDIEDALRRNPITEGYEVDVAVRNGTVTLTGTVDTFTEMAEAEDVASGIIGVRRIHNNLDVSYTEGLYSHDAYAYPYYPHVYSWSAYVPSSTILSDAEIRDEVRDELWWSPYVDEDQVMVTVEAGTATLSGTVDSFSEFRAAGENAYEGGALAVDNDLRISAGSIP